jgi:hypothetical protein
MLYISSFSWNIDIESEFYIQKVEETWKHLLVSFSFNNTQKYNSSENNQTASFCGNIVKGNSSSIDYNRKNTHNYPAKFVI